MHFCFLNPSNEFYSPVSGGAIATIIMEHARFFLSEGHRATILTPRNDDPVYAVGDVVQVRVASRDSLSVPQRALSRIRRSRGRWDQPYYEHYRGSFQKALRQIDRPDVIICYNDFVSPRYIKAAVPTARVIVNLQNEQRTDSSHTPSLLRSVDTIVACSSYIRAYTKERFGIPDEQIIAINNGINLEAFHPREGYDSPESPVRVLCIGRIDPNKGADIAADAVKSLQQEGLPVSLSVAGGVWFYGNAAHESDPYLNSLKEKVARVKGDYLGHVTRPDVPALVRAHDVVCVLSRSQDPNPLVCLEGMASGCAVIGANRGGIPDAFGDAGILVDPDNHGAVTDALRRLVAEPAFLAEQKRRSVERASRASWDKMARKLEDHLVGTK